MTPESAHTPAPAIDIRWQDRTDNPSDLLAWVNDLQTNVGEISDALDQLEQIILGEIDIEIGPEARELFG